ncbi:MAG: hypothetical protein ABIJ57_12350, partial [Pseudomonadota bacterium]
GSDFPVVQIGSKGLQKFSWDCKQCRNGDTVMDNRVPGKPWRSASFEGLSGYDPEGVWYLESDPCFAEKSGQES